MALESWIEVDDIGSFWVELEYCLFDHILVVVIRFEGMTLAKE